MPTNNRNEIFCVSYTDSKGNQCKQYFGKGQKGQEMAAAFVSWLMYRPENLKKMLVETRNKEGK